MRKAKFVDSFWTLSGVTLFLVLFSISDFSSMCRMLGSHTGKHLACALEALLKGFGIEKKVGFLFVYSHCFMSKLTDISDKILAIVCDNASNNDTMINEIELEGFRGAACHVRCRIFLTWVSRYVGSTCALFHYSPHTKAILSQFAYELKPTSTDQADQDSNDGDDYFSDNSDVEECNDDDALWRDVTHDLPGLVRKERHPSFARPREMRHGSCEVIGGVCS